MELLTEYRYAIYAVVFWFVVVALWILGLRSSFKDVNDSMPENESIYIPGIFRCAKCDLDLVSTNLHVPGGGMSANDKPQRCPNGCGPLWRVTYKEHYHRGDETIDRLHDMCGEYEAKIANMVDKNEIAPLLSDVVPMRWTGRPYDFAIYLSKEQYAKLQLFLGEQP